MRITLAVAVACLTFGGLAAAGDATAAIRQPTNIPAEGLGPALTTLAKVFDVQILYRTEVVGRLRTGGVSGAMTAPEALERMLTGTGLTYKYLDDKTVTIVPLSTTGSSQSTTQNAAGSSDAASGSKEAGKKTSQDFRLAQVDQGKTSSTPSLGEQGSTSQEKKPSPGLEEIVVTAQKREERLQDVPISISVLSGADLDTSTSQGVIDELSRVPGVAVLPPSFYGASMLAVRGVAANGVAGDGASPIAFYLDGVPFGFVRSAWVPDTSPFDLQRVEVLR
jgi:iron complex outermembrane receptor protein